MSKEFGDFQTPPELIELILKSIDFRGSKWPRIFEPACGQGNFIISLLQNESPPKEIQAIEIQENHLKIAKKRAKNFPNTSVFIQNQKIFDLNFQKDLNWQTSGSLLVIGNPPWVTNSQLGIEGSNNLPKKTNLKNLSGLEAITGSANFDISEYIWLKLIKELAEEKPTIALLCKTSVARNVLKFAFDNSLAIEESFIKKIDAKKWFNASVSACLFFIKIGSLAKKYQADIYKDLQAKQPISTMGLTSSGQIIADLKAYKRSFFIEGISSLNWHQGLKHDAASVMELTYDNNLKGLKNKLGKNVNVEPEYVYPLLKSSDIFHGKNPTKSVIVTQKCLGSDTLHLQYNAPKLWKYLNTYIERFEKRKSSIYRGKPPFSIFGIGDYSLTHYKVGISGLYKIPKFRAIGLVKGRPVMLDDTCYFIACFSPEQVAFITSLLNHPVCLNFIYSCFFDDAKRPITKKLLKRIDLKAILENIEIQSLLSQAEIEFESLHADLRSKPQPKWPRSLEELLHAKY
ncbi:MAG: N-6 DNA methylase [Prochloraceae cyanobacterium]|nr:N-6 DNA methylase [Prochloraceae cyanobacterium]